MHARNSKKPASRRRRVTSKRRENNEMRSAQNGDRTRTTTHQDRVRNPTHVSFGGDPSPNRPRSRSRSPIHDVTPIVELDRNSQFQRGSSSNPPRLDVVPSFLPLDNSARSLIMAPANQPVQETVYLNFCTIKKPSNGDGWMTALNTLNAQSFDYYLRKGGVKIMEKCRAYGKLPFHEMLKMLRRHRDKSDFSLVEDKVILMFHAGVKHLPFNFLVELDNENESILTYVIRADSVRMLQFLMERSRVDEFRNASSDTVITLSFKHDSTNVLIELLQTGQMFHYFACALKPLKGEEHAKFRHQLFHSRYAKRYEKSIRTLKNHHQMLEKSFWKARQRLNFKIDEFVRGPVICFPRGPNNSAVDHDVQFRTKAFIESFFNGQVHTKVVLAVMSAKFDYATNKYICSNLAPPKLKSVPKIDNTQCLVEPHMGPFYFTASTIAGRHFVKYGEHVGHPIMKPMGDVEFLWHPELFTVTLKLEADPEFPFVVAQLIKYEPRV